jgi:hypothetical protein
MNAHLAHELLNELASSLETLEAQQSALLQFLKEKGVVTDDQLAPYLNQAGNASNVRWLAARVRLERIFSAEAEKEQAAAQEQKQAVAQTPPPETLPAVEGAANKDRDNDKKDRDNDKNESNTDSQPGETERALARKEKASRETSSAIPGGKEEANGEEKRPSTTKRNEEAA